MSEDGVHGSPAAREKFARDHRDYDNPHPKAARPAARRGGHSPVPHKPPTVKHVAVPTTQEHHFVEKLTSSPSSEPNVSMMDGRRSRRRTANIA